MYIWPIVSRGIWTDPSAVYYPPALWLPPYTGADPWEPYAVIGTWFLPFAEISDLAPYAKVDGFNPYGDFTLPDQPDRAGGPQFMSYTQNLVMDRGDEPTWPVKFYESDGVTAFDITGGKLYFTAKESTAYGDARAVFQKSSPSNGITVTSATGGEANIKLARADTSSLPPKKLRLEYDLQLIESDGTILTMTRGILIVRPDVTRAES